MGGIARFQTGLHFTCTSSSAEEMKEQSAYWSYEHRQYGKGSFKGNIDVFHTAQVQISLAYRSTGFFAKGGLPNGCTIVSFPLLNSNAIYYRGRSLGYNQAIALHYREESELYTREPSLMLTLAVDHGLMEEMTGEILNKPFAAIRDQDRLIMTKGKDRQLLRQLVLWIKYLQQAQDGTTPASIEDQEVEREILESILLTIAFPEKTSTQPDRMYRAKRAAEHINSNLSSPLTIDDLCRYAETKERTLYLGFRERFGVSPKKYLRIMRLNKVRKELLENNKAVNSISFIAMNSGFSNLGRFSEQYRRMFGETPSKTREKKKAFIASKPFSWMSSF